ncbi:MULTISPECIES: hypothetical protein [Chromobacterium]|uniref:Uncharacterized protein n=1 Tax=Chromobacterium aquaticum TaxID=467180 RepID=A0ABV8ZWM5_9NEIS|nr:hypothetical protein [Chromobacterium aquaticum]MCD5360534.1 hypothetical protein [Chromobacterium aquaticum]
MPTRPRLPALLPLLLLAACATPPNKPFSDFDQATRKVQLSTGNTLERIQHNARLNAVLTAPNAPLNPDTFRLQTGSGAGYDLAPALGQLQATLDTLALYARTLNGLAGDREAEARVDAAAQDLADSIQDLKRQGGNEDAAKILATAADALGRQLTAAQRQAALRKVMATAQPGLELLADNSHRALSMLPAYLTVIRDSLLRHANFSRPPYGSWQRYQFDLAIADRLRELERIEAALQASDQAIQGFPAANRQLLQNLDAPASSLQALRAFAAEARRLRDFYRELPDK